MPRAKGAKGKKSIIARDIVNEILSSGKDTPLQFLVKTMHDSRKPIGIRLDAAKVAAQFCHPKPSQKLELGGDPENPTPIQTVVTWANNE